MDNVVVRAVSSLEIIDFGIILCGKNNGIFGDTSRQQSLYTPSVTAFSINFY